MYLIWLIKKFMSIIKEFRYIFLISIFIFFSSALMKGEDLRTAQVVLNKIQKTLTAPKAEKYTWYYNNSRLDFSSRQLKIVKAGNYKVITTDQDGNISTASINVGVNANGDYYTIYIVGDSTACNWASGYYPKKGWGQVLSSFFDDHVTIQNKAISGTSSKSFYDIYWTAIKDVLQPGDYVFIQFGINDAKDTDPARYTEPFTTFTTYLTNFVNETKAKGAIPVMMTTVRRNAWTTDDPPELYDAYHDYPVAARQLAQNLGLPLIDMDQLTIPLLEGLGPDYVGPYMYMILDVGEYPNYSSGSSDQVHFQEMGAIEMARLVANELKTFENDTSLNKLIPHIKPMMKVEVTSNYPWGIDLITRTAEYPEGVNITVKTKTKPSFDFQHWADENDTKLSTKELYTFTMGNYERKVVSTLYTDLNYDCFGDLNGSAYIDSCGTCVEGNTGLLACVNQNFPGQYKIVSARSNLCLQDKGDSVTQEKCLDNNSQYWIIEHYNDYYTIKNVGSKKYLSAPDTASESVLVTSDVSTRWIFERKGTDTLEFVLYDNNKMVAEIGSYSLRSGKKMRLYPRIYFENQRFILVRRDEISCMADPENCTSVNSQIITKDQIVISPVPVQSKALLTFREGTEYPYDFSVYDASGKLVYLRNNIRQNQLEFGKQLGSGFYIGKIIINNQIITLKFIKD